MNPKIITILKLDTSATEEQVVEHVQDLASRVIDRDQLARDLVTANEALVKANAEIKTLRETKSAKSKN